MPYGLLREVLRGTILDVAQHQPQESLNAMIQAVVPEAAGSDQRGRLVLSDQHLAAAAVVVVHLRKFVQNDMKDDHVAPDRHRAGQDHFAALLLRRGVDNQLGIAAHQIRRLTRRGRQRGATSHLRDLAASVENFVRQRQIDGAHSNSSWSQPADARRSSYFSPTKAPVMRAEQARAGKSVLRRITELSSGDV